MLRKRNNFKTTEIPFWQRPSCTMREACRASGLSRTTLYERMAAGDLKTTTVGRRRLVNVRSLLKLVGAGPEVR
jgi:predicted DNA-binding transcriptional regulator AlpA